jgi:hypothetical protein
VRRFKGDDELATTSLADVQMPCSGLDAKVVRALTSLARSPAPDYLFVFTRIICLS